MSWDSVAGKINQLMKKIQYSGYSKEFRYDVVKSALNAADTIDEKVKLGIRPRQRPKQWRQDEREQEKEEKKRKWFKSFGFETVLFVPATCESRLKRLYQKEIAGSGIRVKVVERPGLSLKRQLQRSNPFKDKKCMRDQCFVCSTDGNGNCTATHKVLPKNTNAKEAAH